MKSIVIVYHSAYGHTERIAHAIAAGVSQVGETQAVLMRVDRVNWQQLDQADMIVMGCPTYMGSMPAAMKSFMDATSKRWFDREWQGKWAAGFANSGGLSGDKLAVLQQICLFAMQHGMLWAGLPLLPTGNSPQDLNRMSGFLGLMTQSEDAPSDKTPPAGDLATARWFGEYLAGLVWLYRPHEGNLGAGGLE